MGRVARAGGSDSGRAGEHTKNIGKPRTKRRRRKDLEELHRNVLDAKRNLCMQAPQKKKKKTALEKVLKNFADKRQEIDDKNHGVTGKKGRNKEPRTICERLLPEPVLGIFQNGAKGRAVQRAKPELSEVNVARLRGDVLKLLNGDETNPKCLWNGGEKRAEKAKGSQVLPSDESDYASSNEGGASRANTPFHSGETKGIKRAVGKKKANLAGEDAAVGAKAEQQCFRQKENKCKRRLFEPNDDQIDSTFHGNRGNRSDFRTNGIRFSPPRDIAGNVSPSEDCFRTKQHLESRDVETRKKAEKKNMPIDASIYANFRGWSPTVYYERLCAMICAENFENYRGEQPSASDPVTKIRRALSELYRNACRYRRAGRKTVTAKGDERREQALPKVRFPLEDSSFPSSMEIQACTTDSELDQEFSDSDPIKVGSWRPRHFRRACNSKDPSILSDTNEPTVGSKDPNNKIQSKKDQSAAPDIHNRFCEKTADRVEKTINSVSLFLEKLRKNNPLNGKRNIFEVEVAAAQLSQQKEHLDDYSSEPPIRDLTFDVNLRKLVRRNAKHVPTILRRSNSRGADEKQQPPPSNNWVESVPKRSTRTIAALPRWSPSKHDESDDLQTPSVVNHLAVINKGRANILKSKRHLLRAKYESDAMFVPSQYQELEKSSEKYGKCKESEVSANRVFVQAARMNDREWYHSDPLLRDQEHTGEPMFDPREEERESRRVHFGNKKVSRDFKEPHLRTMSTSFPEGKYAQRAARPENPRYHMNTASNFSSFEFARPELLKKSDVRDRQTFSNEAMSHSLSGEVGEKTFVRPRYLLEDSEESLSTRVSPVSYEGSSASQCLNEIQLLPEEYVERISMYSEAEERLKNSSFKPLPSYRTDTSSLDRLPNEVVGCTQHCRGVSFGQRIRKPVMLFRPIQESRQQQEISDSRYRLSENGDATVNDTVRNIGVLIVKKRNNNCSGSQCQTSHDPKMYHPSCEQQLQPQHSLSQLHCHRQPADTRQRHNQEFNTQPTKYLAFDETDGEDPRRLPIYVKTIASNVGHAATGTSNREYEPSKLFNAYAKPENGEVMCSRRHNIDDPRLQHAARLECCGLQQQLQELGPRRASQLTLMLPCPAPLSRQASANIAATTAPTLGPSSKDIPRFVYSMTACETLVPAEMTYQLAPPLYTQSRHDSESLSKRVQLPDGRVGILVSENCSIDNQECPNGRAGPTLSFKRGDMENLNERKGPGLSNEGIYY